MALMEYFLGNNSSGGRGQGTIHRFEDVGCTSITMIYNGGFGKRGWHSRSLRLAGNRQVSEPAGFGEFLRPVGGPSGRLLVYPGCLHPDCNY